MFIKDDLYELLGYDYRMGRVEETLTGKDLQEKRFPYMELLGYGKKRAQEITWMHVHSDKIAVEEDGDGVYISRRITR